MDMIKRKYEKTFAMIKPGSFKDLYEIKNMIMKSGKKIRILDFFSTTMKRSYIEKLYEVHKDRGFYNDMCASYEDKEVHLMILGGFGVVSKVRDLLGATDPKKAVEGTLRHRFGVDIDNNVMHSSDSVENALREKQFFNFMKSLKPNPYRKKHTPHKILMNQKNEFRTHISK